MVTMKGSILIQFASFLEQENLKSYRKLSTWMAKNHLFFNCEEQSASVNVKQAFDFV